MPRNKWRKLPEGRRRQTERVTGFQHPRLNLRIACNVCAALHCTQMLYVHQTWNIRNPGGAIWISNDFFYINIWRLFRYLVTAPVGMSWNISSPYEKKTKLRGLSTQANCTDRATAACQRSWCQLLWVEGVAWSAQRIPTADNLGFPDRSRYFFFQVTPQLSSRGWVDHVPDPLLLRKSGRAGNRTPDLWTCGQKLWPLDES
jgi:hypothetical protein